MYCYTVFVAIHVTKLKIIYILTGTEKIQPTGKEKKYFLRKKLLLRCQKYRLGIRDQSRGTRSEIRDPKITKSLSGSRG
jgi:hypothetical protein